MLLFRFYPAFGTFVSDMSTTHNRPPQPRLGTRSCGSRSRPLFDPGREQVDYLSDAGRADVRPASGRIDPAEVGLAVELCQRVEERARSRVGRERGGDVAGKIVALRTFRCQLNGHVAADRDARIAQPHRAHRQRPSAGARRKRPADPPAINRAAHGMLSLGTPRLVRYTWSALPWTMRIGAGVWAAPAASPVDHGGVVRGLLANTERIDCPAVAFPNWSSHSRRSRPRSVRPRRVRMVRRSAEGWAALYPAAASSRDSAANGVVAACRSRAMRFVGGSSAAMPRRWSCGAYCDAI